MLVYHAGSKLRKASTQPTKWDFISLQVPEIFGEGSVGDHVALLPPYLDSWILFAPLSLLLRKATMQRVLVTLCCFLYIKSGHC